jgi:hypothetical protein
MIARTWFLLCCAWAALWLYGGIRGGHLEIKLNKPKVKA